MKGSGPQPSRVSRTRASRVQARAPAKKRVWPRPAARPIEKHEVWIEEVHAPTPTSFVLQPLEEQLPSSRQPVTAPADEPPTPSARARSRRVAVKHHWLAIVVTFVAVATLVADGDEIARVVKQLRGPAKSLFHFGGGIAQASDQPPSPCPKDMALVDAGGVRVCVDRFEDAIVEIDAAGKEHEHSPYLSVEGLHVKAVSEPNVVPQAYISRDEAEAACKEAGKRLCRVDEWVTACMGPDRTLYPYDDQEDVSACNTHGVEPLGALFPNYGAEIYDFRVMNDPSLDALDGTVSKTGAYPRCSNDWGVFDMVGNLHEWTTEVTGTKGEFHGGYYLDTHQNGDGCKYATYVHERTYHDYSTGFRCCADPK